MIDRIIDISDSEAHVRTRDGLLVLERSGEHAVTIPWKEVGCLVLGHAAVTLSRAAMADMAQAGSVLIVCDGRLMPVSMTLPLSGYFAPAERFAAQACASLPLKKRLWQEVVRAKIRSQAQVLSEARGDDFGLSEIARQVRSGDSDNHEAQAARVYWSALFNSVDFLRQREGQDQNRYLNYGYAVLRALTARAICGSGLHPCLGIHHHHRNNPFCLADDLMEPLRPIVDRCVVGLMEEFGPDAPLDRAVKGRLLSCFQERITVAGEQRTIFDSLAMLSASLGRAFERKESRLILPEAV